MALLRSHAHPHHAPHTDDSYPVAQIQHKAVRAGLVELFAATRAKLTVDIAGAVADAVGGINLMLDILEDKKSKRKWLGALPKRQSVCLNFCSHLSPSLLPNP